jgi:hypothetical protein
LTSATTSKQRGGYRPRLGKVAAGADVGPTGNTPGGATGNTPGAGIGEAPVCAPGAITGLFISGVPAGATGDITVDGLAGSAVEGGPGGATDVLPGPPPTVATEPDVLAPSVAPPGTRPVPAGVAAGASGANPVSPIPGLGAGVVPGDGTPVAGVGEAMAGGTGEGIACGAVIGNPVSAASTAAGAGTAAGTMTGHPSGMGMGGVTGWTCSVNGGVAAAGGSAGSGPSAGAGGVARSGRGFTIA